MASKDYLFVNKDSRSPSLSRNTGTEASLASRVNKHVQQQRFWRSSGPRRSWYRPFVRSDSTSSAPSPAASEPALLDEAIEPNRRLSYEQRSPRVIRRSISSHHSSPDALKRGPRTLSQEQAVPKEDLKFIKGRWLVPSELMNLMRHPPHSPDPINTVVVPLTPLLVEVLQKHLRWALSASLSDFTVHEGVKSIFSEVLQDKMHAAAFLAMVTAQQRRIGDLAFPHDQSPELYSYRATKLIREHLERQKGPICPTTIVDIFRLAMCEWFNGNRDAARIHLAYVSKSWKTFVPKTALDHHVVEVCSTEDIFLAIDVDCKPLLDLNWEPDLPIGPQPSTVGPQTTVTKVSDVTKSLLAASEINRGSNARLLEDSLRENHSPLTAILRDCMTGLASFPQFTRIDFGSALSGPTWVMKRRIHACIHRLQSLQLQVPSPDDSIRLTMVILLLFASTTPERRTGRTDMARIAERLQASLENLESLRTTGDSPRKKYNLLQDSRLWLWMYVVGLMAAKQPPSRETTRQWFTKRALFMNVKICGPFATLDNIEKNLAHYVYLGGTMARTVEALASTIAARNNWQDLSVASDDKGRQLADIPD